VRLLSVMPRTGCARVHVFECVVGFFWATFSKDEWPIYFSISCAKEPIQNNAVLRKSCKIFRVPTHRCHLVDS